MSATPRARRRGRCSCPTDRWRCCPWRSRTPWPIVWSTRPDEAAALADDAGGGVRGPGRRGDRWLPRRGAGTARPRQRTVVQRRGGSLLARAGTSYWSVMPLTACTPWPVRARTWGSWMPLRWWTACTSESGCRRPARGAARPLPALAAIGEPAHGADARRPAPRLPRPRRGADAAAARGTRSHAAFRHRQACTLIRHASALAGDLPSSARGEI